MISVSAPTKSSHHGGTENTENTENNPLFQAHWLPSCSSCPWWRKRGWKWPNGSSWLPTSGPSGARIKMTIRRRLSFWAEWCSRWPTTSPSMSASKAGSPNRKPTTPSWPGRPWPFGWQPVLGGGSRGVQPSLGRFWSKRKGFSRCSPW